MNPADLEATLKLVFIALWFAIPALLVARLRRFRIVASAITFWAFGTLYFGVLSPPGTPLDFGQDWFVIGWLPGALYAAVVARVHAKLHHIKAATASVSAANPNDNSLSA
jgi:hypothetical protein